MRNQEEETSRRRRLDLFTNCWILFPLTIVALGITAIVSFSFFSWHIKEAMDNATTDTMDAVLGLVAGHMQPLVEANRSTFAIASTIKSVRNIASFSDVVDKVAPSLFLAFAMQPLLSQMSYVRLDGITFSYYRNKGSLTSALFSNSSDALSHFDVRPWYSQTVDPATGNLVGNAVVPTRPPQLPNMTRSLLESKAGSYASVGVGWVRSKDQMLFFTAPVGGDIGMVSAAIAVEDSLRAISSIDLHGVQLYYAITDTKSSQDKPQKNDAKMPEDEREIFSSVNCTISVIDAPKLELVRAGSNKYKAACINFDVSGIRLVFQLVLPYKHTSHMLQEMKIIVIVLVCAMIIGVMVAGYLMLKLFRRSQVQEALLCANLIRQKEAVQQAERKSMNKSNAFASASHDIRSSLATIAGLIDISRPEVPSHSDMAHNLEQMDVCAKKLLGILNSILDISKVESGKMQLEQVEFNMADVLEESVDMINVVGLNKGIEVIWDPCDFSVLKSGNVKGDCRRFKQILDNLLGNAIKFTQEGHVILRAWANKPIIRSSNVPSKFGHPKSNTFFRWLFRTRKDCIDHHSLDSIQNDPNHIEFYFEVDDSGIGIPKEKRDSVFENYVQVKEGHGGTGLGLGIVQSFVRLMGGEISIQDKEPGERGTCFRFNVFLKSSEMHEDHEANEGISALSVEMTGSTIRASAFSEVSSLKGAHCLLFVQGNETRRILQAWMENLGVKVWMIPHVELLASTLEKMRRSISSPGRTASPCETEGCFSPKDMVNQILPVTMKHNNSRRASFGGPSFGVLVIVDLSDSKFEHICAEMKNFIETNRHIPCKVICLADLKTSSDDLKRFEQMCCDHALRKPIHGSRLYALLRIMRDLQGSHTRHSSQVVVDSATPNLQELTKAGTSTEVAQLTSKPEGPDFGREAEDDKPLSRMHFLLVEDILMLRNIEKRMLSQLGATVELAEDGSIALHMIKEALEQASISEGQSISFPYDVVLMDCEMPVMNGYEATKCIREEESRYGIHIPIIALTAHAMTEELQKTILAGMDLHLTKPIERKSMVEAVRRVCKDRQN